MLAYAFQVLHEGEDSRVDAEEFEYAGDLLADILEKGISHQIKRGLGREYVRQADALVSPRGKIDVSASVKRMTMLKKRLICEFDEFTVNAYLNQVLNP